MRGGALFRRAVVCAAAVCAFAGLAGGGHAADPFDTRINDWLIDYDEATFWFHSVPTDMQGMTFECRHDDEIEWAGCASPVKRTELEPGTHSIEIRAVAPDGTVDETPSKLTWTATERPPPPPPPGPSNDHFFTASEITGTAGAVDGTTVLATAQWDEPYSPYRAGHSVWYLWTAPRDGNVTFTAASSDFAPAVSVFTAEYSEFKSPVSAGVGSTSFKAWYGQSYRIAVDGEQTGAFRLSWSSEAAAQPNDFFSDATELEGPTGSVQASNIGATGETNEVRHDGSAGYDDIHSVWFRWTSPATGHAFFTTTGSSFDATLVGYAGTSAQDVRPTGFPRADVNPWSKESRVEIPVTEGQVVYLALDGQQGATGTTSIAWRTTVSTGDTTWPSVTMTSPAPSEYVTGTLHFTAEAFDDEGIDRVEYSIAPNDGSVFPDWYVGEAYEPPYEVTLDTSALAPGFYSVQATAFDASGNQVSYGSAVWVDMTPPPTLIVPKADVRAEATSSSGATVTFATSGRDFRGTPLPVSCKPASGSTFRLGVTPVSCSTTDSYGGRTTRSFRVVVEDTTPPALTLPKPISVDATSTTGAVVEFSATAVDLVGGVRLVICEPASGSTFAIGDTTVACHSGDPRGNWGFGSFAVHVKGAIEQVRDLRSRIAAFGFAASASEKLQQQLLDIEKHLAGDHLTAACGGLQEFATRIAKESRTEGLVADAARIRTVSGC